MRESSRLRSTSAAAAPVVAGGSISSSLSQTAQVRVPPRRGSPPVVCCPPLAFAVPLPPGACCPEEGAGAWQAAANAPAPTSTAIFKKSRLLLIAHSLPRGFAGLCPRDSQQCRLACRSMLRELTVRASDRLPPLRAAAHPGRLPTLPRKPACRCARAVPTATQRRDPPARDPACR